MKRTEANGSFENLTRKKFMNTKTLLWLTCVIAGSFALPSEANSARHTIVAFAPALPDDQRDNIARLTANLVIENLAGSKITLVNAATLNTVVALTVPEGSKRLRQQRLTPQIAAVIQAIRAAANSAAFFNVPVVLDHISRQVRDPGTPTTVLLLGPALYRNPKEPAFDMTFAWPSDGHLAAGNQRSVFSTVERSHRLDDVAVAWLVTDTLSLVNEGHREGVARFWTLFVGSQGGTLAAFSPDVRNVFGHALAGRSEAVILVAPDSQDMGVIMRSRKIEPLPASVATNASVALVAEGLAGSASPLPTVASEDTGIGIVWQAEPGQSSQVDLDLYVQPSQGGPELFFDRTSSPHGRYHRDLRQSLPTSGGNWRSLWEFVELRGDQIPPVVWINRKR